MYKHFCQATNPGQRVFHQKFKEKLQKSNSHSETLNCLCNEYYFKVYFEPNNKDSKKSGMV